MEILNTSLEAFKNSIKKFNFWLDRCNFEKKNVTRSIVSMTNATLNTFYLLNWTRGCVYDA